ncbi:MAG TPA: hypothetical protein VFB22_10890 [Candidatus Baltobacteraceae bacterium]|nr:hypothetical protein [Candidatus Baltobacteraceae bacterium]
MSTNRIVLDIFRPLAIGAGIFGATAAIGAAQAGAPCAPGPATWSSFDPAYNNVTTWQSAWDTGAYDRNHVMLGTVGQYKIGRLTIANGAGDTTTVDLKEGTVIEPTGSTPHAGQRVAVFGYWSNGTFIANRVVLHG